MKQKTKHVSSTARLSWLERISYGIGLGGGGIIYTLGTTFLLVYYTNVVRIDPAISASIIAISKIFDGLSDLAMGYIIDHTHSRFGKARPWLMRFCVPTMLCLFAAFAVPGSWAGTAQIVYIFVTYNLFFTICYTVVAVSYNALNSLITLDQYERGINNVLGITFNTIAMLLLNMTMLKMCTFFGGGDLYSGKGWSISVGILCLVYGVCVTISMLVCKEMKTPSKPETTAARKDKTQKLGAVKTVRMLVTNKYWVLYVLGMIAITMSSGIIMGTALFYAENVLGDAYSYSTLSTALYLAMFIGVISTSVLIKKIGKRNTALIGCCFLAGGTILAGLLPATFNNTLITMIIRGFGVGFPTAVGGAMLQDSLTYGKWKTGIDMVGMGNAASSFSSKMAGGLGTAIIGWVMSAGGFSAALPVQPDSAKTAITSLFIWIPLAMVFVTIVTFSLYKLDKEYPRYVADLEAGKFGPGAIVPASAATNTKTGE